MAGYQYIDNNSQLAELVQELGHSPTVVVDTEFMRRDTFYPQAGLIQLCFSADPEQAWLIDPLPVTDFSPLKELFANPAVEKVIHSASEDLEVFQRLLGQQPLPLFDTQRAAAFVGLGFGLGYRALMLETAGIEIAKDETRSDWLQRPLTEDQLSYAATDVVPLLPVYEQLRQRLLESERLHWVLDDGAAAAQAAGEATAATYLRIKSAWKLSRRELAVLQALCDWREDRAQNLDKPRSWIIKDPLCLEIARCSPQSVDELRVITDMPHATVRKQGQRIVDVVATALELDDNQLPQRMPAPLDASQRGRLKLLKKAAAAMALDWGLASEALLPAKDYELMVRLAGGESVETPERWNGWRREPVVQPLLLLAGVKE
jgi:ribonuclease D